MNTSPSTAILIVGMHRSGTSALAGLIGKLGVPLGDHMLEPGSDNPKGYWEHREVVSVHERLFAGLGSRWDDVRALPENWREREVAREATLAISDIISSDFSECPMWAVKDPRLCRLLPLWFEVLQKRCVRPVVLFMVRRPREVSASIEARNHWQPLVGKLLWLRYMTEAITASSAFSREVLLYDDLLADPLATVLGALAKLGIDVGEWASARQREAVAGFVDVSDRHHVSLGLEEPATKIDAIAESLYESLVAVAHGDNDWKKVEKVVLDFDREWSQSGACTDAVADMAARIELRLRAAETENARLSSELTAQVRWSEDAQARFELLQAQTAEMSSKLTAQIRWSDEAQAERESLQAEHAELSSKLAAQVRRSEDEQARFESLQAEASELSSKLNAQVRWTEEARARQEMLQLEKAELSSKLDTQVRRAEEVQAKCDALLARCAELSSELIAKACQSDEAQVRHDALVAQHADLAARQLRYEEKCGRLERDLERAQQSIRGLSLHLASSEAEATQTRTELTLALDDAFHERSRILGELERARTAGVALATELRNVYASTSWRMTKPWRSVTEYIKRKTGRASNSTGKLP
ncbi:MAG: hypothetical protein ABS82_10755 [Rhodanobacter sp. SCN 67-45]|nr:MAG: hypothetical protein ABS82_10755 [Rhodanobacter sp. SCN 67-45]